MTPVKRIAADGPTPSALQKKVMAWVRNAPVKPGKPPRKKNCIVRARAGTGKTWTIMKSLEYATEDSVKVMAFNKTIEEELTRRLKAMNLPNVKALTIHGTGYRAVLKAWPGVRLLDKTAAISRAAYLTQMVCASWPQEIAAAVSRLHTIARETRPHATDWNELVELAWKHDCVPDHIAYDEEDICRAAIECMALAADEKLTRTRGMDFADMIFLPLRCNLLRRTEGLVVVDEAQDMTEAQLEIALGICRTNGRIMLVGDDRQGIYAFRGADTGCLDRLKTALDAEEFPLNISYRCGKKIAAYARRLVPDFEAGPDNPEGEILTMARAAAVKMMDLGDFVVSRKNAPLVGICIACLRAGKRARIKGKDIGKDLIHLVDKLSRRSDSINEFLEYLEAWRMRESEKWMAAEKPDRMADVDDKANMLVEMSDGAEDLQELRIRIETLFTETGLGDADVVTCSSIHKAKGLEANRVFVLTNTLYAGSDFLEEQNLEYVAVTRAKNTLVLVS
jgi:superfamily I DNA/RNA helicase